LRFALARRHDDATTRRKGTEATSPQKTQRRPADLFEAALPAAGAAPAAGGTVDSAPSWCSSWLLVFDVVIVVASW